MGKECLPDLTEEHSQPPATSRGRAKGINTAPRPPPSSPSFRSIPSQTSPGWKKKGNVCCWCRWVGDAAERVWTGKQKSSYTFVLGGPAHQGEGGTYQAGGSPGPLLPTGCVGEEGERDQKVPFATIVQTEMWMDHGPENSRHHSGSGRWEGWEGGAVFLIEKVPIKRMGWGEESPLTGPSRPPPCLPAPAFCRRGTNATRAVWVSVEQRHKFLSTLSQQHNPSISGTSNRLIWN